MLHSLHAQGLAHAAAGAVGGDQQARRDFALTIRVGDAHAAQAIAVTSQAEEARGPLARQVLQLSEPGSECLAEIARHHHLAEGLVTIVRCLQCDPAEIALAADMDALDAGALDFLPKKFEDIARDKDEAVKLLQQRVREIARKRFLMAAARPRAPEPVVRPALGAALARPLERQPEPVRAAAAPASFKRSGKSYQLVAIGTSTGGPVALQNVLTKLPGDFPHPMLLIQHMPATFTAAFAARLNGLCQIGVKEAEDGDVLRPGHAYLAPGGKQMLLEGRGPGARLRIIEGNDKVNYKPCVDITFASAAKIYGDKVLAIVLTGMGADGRDGARLLKEQGATIWAQDEASCVVYGMPQAVAKAGIASESLPLDRVAQRILVELGR